MPEPQRVVLETGYPIPVGTARVAVVALSAGEIRLVVADATGEHVADYTENNELTIDGRRWLVTGITPYPGAPAADATPGSSAGHPAAILDAQN